MNRKGFLDISFSWIFAVLVGGMILFGAIYGLNKFSDTRELQEGAEIGTEFNNLLSSLETDVESSKVLTLGFPVESRISNICQKTSSFGRQGIAINERTKDNQWTKNSPKIYSENSYIFSKSISQGKKFYSFSKPLELPFKVADLIYVIPESDKYCFVNAPRAIEDELENLNNPNLLIEDCSDRSDVIKVCFAGGTNCDIEVSYNSNYLTKGETESEFLTDALMYAAIFSDSAIYECELSRIFYRTSVLASIYKEKGLNLIANGCNSPIISDLSQYSMGILQISNSGGLHVLGEQIEMLAKQNKYSTCKLW